MCLVRVCGTEKIGTLGSATTHCCLGTCLRLFKANFRFHLVVAMGCGASAKKDTAFFPCMSEFSHMSVWIASNLSVADSDWFLLLLQLQDGSGSGKKSTTGLMFYVAM